MLGRLRIPATLQACHAFDRRQQARTRLPASNDLTGIDFVVVTDISTGGAQLITPVPLQIGSEVRLRLPMVEPVRGTLVWVSSRLAGCEFADPLHPALLRVLLLAATADPDEWRRSMSNGPFAAQ